MLRFWCVRARVTRWWWESSSSSGPVGEHWKFILCIPNVVFLFLTRLLHHFRHIVFENEEKKMNSRSLSHFRLIEKINKIWKHNWKIYKTSFHFIFYYFSLSVALCGRSRSLGVFLFFALSHVTIHNRIVVDGWTHQRDSFVILLTFITFLKKSHLTILSSHFLLGFFFVSNNRQHQWYFLMTKNAIN